MKNLFPLLHLVCSNDDMRPTMNFVKVCKDFTVATDAHVLVYYKTEEIFNQDFIDLLEEPIYIHSDDWKILHKNDGYHLRPDGIIEIMQDKKRDQLIKVDKDKNYPKWENIIPTGEMKETFKVGFNADLLLKAQKVMLSKIGLEISFFGANKGVLAKPANGHCTRPAEKLKGTALIMPIKID